MDATATITALRERRRRPAAMLAGIAMALSLSVVLSSGPPGSEAQAAWQPPQPEFAPYPHPAISGSSVPIETPARALLAQPSLAVTSPAWTQTATHYLKSDWKLADGYARRVAVGVAHASVIYRVDPMLLLAIAAAESSFHHDIGNPGGGQDPLKPYGIMQVAGEFHRDKFPGGQVATTSVEQNINLGAAVLRQYLNEENGDVRLALRRYGGTTDDRYYRRVNHFSMVFHRELSSSPLDD
jgi:soluble lytic murein transglycosylase-like protein